MHDHHYIPPLGYHWLTRLYDPAHRLLAWNRAYMPVLVERVGLGQKDRLLDLGCGTATLTIRIKQYYPAATVVGVDVDSTALALAQRKATRAATAIMLQRGSVCYLPFADGAFDRVVSTLVLHHLNARRKRQALAEAFRVLRPGGEVYIVDFGQPQAQPVRTLALAMRWFEEIGDQVRGIIPPLLQDTGFSAVEELDEYVCGALTLYRGIKPFYSQA